MKRERDDRERKGRECWRREEREREKIEKKEERGKGDSRVHRVSSRMPFLAMVGQRWRWMFSLFVWVSFSVTVAC